jgi:outer membrane immunogenic protein
MLGPWRGACRPATWLRFLNFVQQLGLWVLVDRSKRIIRILHTVALPIHLIALPQSYKRANGYWIFAGDNMKKFCVALAAVASLTATSAFAADMALKAPPPPPVPVASWTGCYIGANVGAGWSRQDQNRISQVGVGPAPAAYGSETDSNVVGGGQVGCDYQFASSWVVGLQGQFDWGKLNGSHALTAFPTFTMNDKTTFFDTATARLGYVLKPNLLGYVKGGAAWVRNSDILLQPAGAGVSEQLTWTRNGYTVGGGLEWAFRPNWSAFVEYNYMNFGTAGENFVAAPGLVPPGELLNVRQTVQDVLVGVNYRFNWASSASAPMFTK